MRSRSLFNCPSFHLAGPPCWRLHSWHEVNVILAQGPIGASPFRISLPLTTLIEWFNLPRYPHVHRAPCPYCVRLCLSSSPHVRLQLLALSEWDKPGRLMMCSRSHEHGFEAKALGPPKCACVGGVRESSGTVTSSVSARFLALLTGCSRLFVVQSEHRVLPLSMDAASVFV